MSPLPVAASRPVVPTSPFESVHLVRTRDAVESVRRALTSGLRGAPVDRRADLAKYLGVNETLAGQVSRSATASSLEAFAASLPPFRGLRQIASRLPDGGRPLRDASDVLERAIGEELGDRWRFDGLFARYNVGPDGEEASTDITVRKEMFRCTASAFGYSADRSQRALVVRPSIDHPDRLDAIEISLKEGIVRTTPGLVVGVSGKRVHTGKAVDREPRFVSPVDAVFDPPAGLPDGCVPGWCAPETAPVRSRIARNGVSMIELTGDAIGAASRCDVAIATHGRAAVPAFQGVDEDGGPVNFRTAVHISEAIAMAEVWVVVHESIARTIGVRFVYTHRVPAEQAIYEPFFHPINIPLPHRQHWVGGGVGANSRFGQLIDETLRVAGWDGSPYLAHSTRTKYPLPQSTLWSWIELPPKPVEHTS
ncbi:MAG: hypothetical protein AAGI30_12915 [Planctomycetota bacterium]